MACLRLVIFAVLGLAAGTLAYRWASTDRPIDAPPRQVHRTTEAGAGARAPAAPPVDQPTLPLALVDAQTGLPYGGVTITAEHDSQLVESVAGADGLATMPAVAGRWRITATSRDGDLLPIDGGGDWQLGEPSALPPSATVRLEPGAPPTDPAAALPQVPPGAAALVGVATLAGARAADVIVTPIFTGDFGPGHAVALDKVPMPTPLAPRRFLGTSGLFRVDGLTPGTYAAYIVAPGRGAAVMRATATLSLAGNLSVELAPAASLSGAVTDQRGALLAGAVVRVRAGGVTLPTIRSTREGTYAFFDLPPGDIELDARAEPCVGDHAKLTLPPGQRSIRALGLVCDTPGDVVTTVPPVQDEP